MTVRTRIVAFSTLIFAVVLCGFAFLLDRSIRTEELVKLDARLESHADKVATELEEQETETQFPDLKSFAELHTDGIPDVNVQVYDSRGNAVLPFSPGSPAFTKEKGTHTSELDGHSFRVLTSESEPDAKERYIIQVWSPAEEMEQRLSELHKFLLVGIPLSILLTFLGASLIVRIAFNPISSIAQAAQHVSGQNLVDRVPVPKSNDEVRQLALALNEMISRLESSFNAQKQFIADASHEIRTPLTVIFAELEFLQSRILENESHESIRTAVDELERLVRLSNNMLLIARLDSEREPVQKAPVRLDELLAGCISKVKTVAAAKSIPVRLVVEDPVEVITDSDKCIMIILNLLDNAIKYSPPAGSTVTVELKTLDSRAGIVISDQGIGIPESQLGRVFDRFFRIDQSRSTVRGTGLGLPIVQRLITLLGGTIQLDSIHPTSPSYTPGSPTGTTVTVTLPRS